MNYRFRGTAMPYGELIIALENIIIDKVSTVHPQPEEENMTPAPQWRLGWQRKKMERMQAKKETSES